MVDTEALGGAYLSLGQGVIVRGVVQVFRPPLIGGEHHRDRHIGQVIHWSALQHRLYTFSAVHLSSLFFMKSHHCGE